MNRWFLAALPILAAAPLPCGAKTVRVADTDPRKFQQAVDTAAYGDTVVVAPGVYGQTILRPGIVLRSEKGPEVTTLRNGQMFIVKATDVDSLTVLEGFTLDGVKACQALVEVKDSPLTVRDCVLKNGWAGIHADHATLRAERLRVSNCQNGFFLQETQGEIVECDIRRCVKGIFLLSSNPRILRSEITGNSLGIEVTEHSDPSIGGSLASANRIYGNPGGAIKNSAMMKRDGFRTSSFMTIRVPYNFWGSDCPDSSNFRGPIEWSPWVDSTSKKSLDRCAKTASR